MTNHLHIIVNANGPFELKDIIRDFKKFSAKKIISQIQTEPESRKDAMLNAFLKAGSLSPKHKTYKFWKTGSHAIELYNERFTWTKIMYIHNNPIKADFVAKPEDWRYSSASNYLGQESLLKEVHCIPAMLQRI